MAALAHADHAAHAGLVDGVLVEHLDGELALGGLACGLFKFAHHAFCGFGQELRIADVGRQVLKFLRPDHGAGGHTAHLKA